MKSFISLVAFVISSVSASAHSDNSLCRGLLASFHKTTPEEVAREIGLPDGKPVHLKFYDWDDNVAVMHTSRIYVMDFKTGETKAITTEEYAKYKTLMGKPGSEWERWQFFDYLVNKSTGEETLMNLERRNSIAHLLGQPGEFENFKLREGSWTDFRDVPDPTVFARHIHDILSQPRGFAGPKYYEFTLGIKDPITRRWMGEITTRGHAPSGMNAGNNEIAKMVGVDAKLNPHLIFPIYNEEFPNNIGAAPHDRKLSVVLAMVELLNMYPPTDPNEVHTFEFSDDDLRTMDHIRADIEKRAADGRLGRVKVILEITSLNKPSRSEHQSPAKILSVTTRLDLPTLVQGRSWFTKNEFEGLMTRTGLSKDELMLALLQEAKQFSRPPTSNYQVGIVGEGASGNVYLGFNVEIEGQSLHQTSHGEQTLIALMALQNETGLKKIALSAAPCGHCRQFMQEIRDADKIEVLIPGRPITTLGALLPDAFGAKDLGVIGGVFQRPTMVVSHRPEIDPPADTDPTSLTNYVQIANYQLLHQAEIFATQSYAPYTGAYAGVAVRSTSGKIYYGIYIESAAYNPSLPPLQVALTEMIRAGEKLENIDTVALVENQTGKISHAPNLRIALQALNPKAKFIGMLVEMRAAN